MVGGRKSTGNIIKEKHSIINDRKPGTEKVDWKIIVYEKQIKVLRV